MKKGQDLKIREKLSKSYMQVIFIASISAIVGIGALLIMTRMYNHALTNYGFSPGRYQEGNDSVYRCAAAISVQSVIQMKILSKKMPRIRIIRKTGFI